MYNKLGDIQLKLGNTDAALTAYNQALEISKKLAADDPKNTQAQRDLLVSFYKFGKIQEKLKNPKVALQYYQQALSIAETLAAKDKLNKQAQDDLAKLKGLVEIHRIRRLPRLKKVCALLLIVVILKS